MEGGQAKLDMEVVLEFLCRENGPIQDMGIVVSQVPISLDRFICLEAAGVAASRMGRRAIERALKCSARQWCRTPAA